MHLIIPVLLINTPLLFQGTLFQRIAHRLSFTVYFHVDILLVIQTVGAWDSHHIHILFLDHGPELFCITGFVGIIELTPGHCIQLGRCYVHASVPAENGKRLLPNSIMDVIPASPGRNIIISMIQAGLSETVIHAGEQDQMAVMRKTAN